MDYTTKIIFNDFKNDPFTVQLLQLTSLTHDSHILNAQERDRLLQIGFISRTGNGWNIVTASGLQWLHDYGFISLPEKSSYIKPGALPDFANIPVTLTEQEAAFLNALPVQFTLAQADAVTLALHLPKLFFDKLIKRKYAKGIIKRVNVTTWEKKVTQHS
jgi:hypothetical protein